MHLIAKPYLKFPYIFSKNKFRQVDSNSCQLHVMQVIFIANNKNNF